MENIENLIKKHIEELKQHPLFALKDLSSEDLRWTFGQWRYAAKKHKEIFAYLIAITKKDRVRYELIQILYDEYGKGNPLFIHGDLLIQTLKYLEVIENEIVPTEKNLRFVETVDKLWKDESHPAVAYGCHLIFEEFGMLIHPKLYALLNDVPAEYKLYSAYHNFAEIEHAEHAFKGMSDYSEEASQLENGIRQGFSALLDLLDAIRPPIKAAI